MENINVVNVQATPELPSEGNKPEALTPEELTPPAPGSKTDPNLLLKSLQEEREKRKQIEERQRALEEELESLKSSSLPEPEVFSDEGKALESKINSLRTELSEMKGELTKKDVIISYPILRDKWTEFDDFRSNPENKGMNLRTAAKAFLIENGLAEVPRKGLEKPTGGQRNPPPSGMTADDVKNLRTTNFKEYQRLLKEGKIKVE